MLMFHISNTDSLKSVYLPYFHSVIKYEKFFPVIHLTLKGIYFIKNFWNMVGEKPLSSHRNPVTK